MPRIDPERARWERVQSLLDTLETLPSAEHEEYLARACPDSELRHEVLAMRAAQTDSERFLDGFAERLGRSPTRTQAGDLSGRQVGAYRLVRPLGRGGMGVVYEAERADGAFEQRVALKLLTIAMEGTEAYGRFLAERQILADLEHPAIARTMDGGVTEDGTPWFAMERVEGEPIDAYCDRQQLDVRERLELFLQVCDVVEHAHRRLVVHRDLKPANVLVTEDRRVKLLDFGIAKLLDTGSASQAAPPTQTALRLMTPEYASPEQVRAEAVTTASDVYQLGLLLYELLTGHRPYVFRGRSASELERVICDQEPGRPSSGVFREDPLTGVSASTIETVCQARRSSPARLQRRLRGDLDNIVLKALIKNPDRRYGSADRLAEDVRRHLEGLPVTARPTTWIYRGRKFLNRHAIGASAAASMLVLLVGMTAIYTAHVRSERNRAQAEAAKAEQVSQFLEGLFRGVDPREAQRVEFTARELLDQGVKQLNEKLKTQPEARADILHVLGRTYLELRILDPAERLLTRALELRKRRLGSEHPDVARVLRDLGELHLWTSAREQARDELEEAARVLGMSLGDEASELADVLSVLGPVEWRLGDYRSGISSLERALSIQERASGVDLELTAAILINLGSMHHESGDPREAVGLYARALTSLENGLGTRHPLVANALLGLASSRRAVREFKRVEPLYRRALNIRERVYGRNHIEVGAVLNNLGDFLIDTGREEEGAQVLRQAVAIFRAAGHDMEAYPLAGLGDVHYARGHLLEARHYYEQSIAIRERSLDGYQFIPLLAHSIVRLGHIEAELGHGPAARTHMNQALEIWRRAPGSADPQLLATLLDLGRWLTEKGRCADAVPLLQRAKRAQIAMQRTEDPEFDGLENLLVGCTGSTDLSTTQRM